MRNLAGPALAALLLLPPAAAHDGLDSGPIGPGGSWTWMAIEEGTLTYRIDGAVAGTVAVAGAGNYTGHRLGIRDGRADGEAPPLRVGDFVTWTNHDNATHRIVGSFVHASAGAKASPLPAAVAAVGVLLASAGLRRARCEAR